ncbi:MAG: helix-turn-helix transcriptional regulator [Micrococcales bacterium]|nr:helix-turn-helix transcriptional regulator [Micrococcales bacterium]
MVTESRGAPALNPYARDCPSRSLLDRIGDRWTVLIIGALGQDTRRFSELARLVDGVSQKMLTQTLRALERDGLVERTVHPVVPPRVEYRLTDEGRSLLSVTDLVERWAVAHYPAIAEAHERYDQRIG